MNCIREVENIQSNLPLHSFFFHLKQMLQSINEFVQIHHFFAGQADSLHKRVTVDRIVTYGQGLALAAKKSLPGVQPGREAGLSEHGYFRH